MRETEEVVDDTLSKNTDAFRFNIIEKIDGANSSIFYDVKQ